MKLKTPLERSIKSEGIEAIARFLQHRIPSVESDMLTFQSKREIYYAQMNDDFDWRTGDRSLGAYMFPEEMKEGMESIFCKMNDSLNIVGGFWSFLVARTVDDIFGTSPYFSLSPEGIEDDTLASIIEKHADWKIRNSNWKDAAIDAISIAIGLGEGIIKTVWERKVDVYHERATVLCDPSGEPYADNTGDYITVDQTEVQDISDPDAGIAASGIYVSKIDTFLPEGDFTWKELDIERTNVSYSGIRAHALHYKDFLCPLNVACIQDSDFIGQQMQMSLLELNEKFNLDEETYSMLASESYEAKTEQAKPDLEVHEYEQSTPSMEHPNPIIRFYECYINIDPVGDRKARRMYVIFVPTINKVIFADYIANMTPNGELPYSVVRAYPIPNRWYGRGLFEIYEKAQEFIDRQLCAVAYKNLFNSNPVTVVEEDSLIMPPEMDVFRFEPNQLYFKKSQVDRDVIKTYTIPDVDQRTWQLMQMMIQVIQVRSGITSAAQGEVSSLPSTSTATGIESIMQSATTLARLPMNNIKAGLEESLWYGVTLIHSNMEVDEVFTYFEGDAQKVETLMVQHVEKLKFDIRLIMTRFKQREMLESGTKGMEIFASYIALPPDQQQYARPLALQSLRGLGIEAADTIIPEPAPMEQLPPDAALIEGEEAVPPMEGIV